MERERKRAGAQRSGSAKERERKGAEPQKKVSVKKRVLNIGKSWEVFFYYSDIIEMQ